MLFTLTGFSQDQGFRMFAFEGVAADRTRTAYTVKADLTLIRKYGIPVQDLPLLCRELLDRCDEGLEQPKKGADNHALTFTEDDMRLHAKNRAAAREAAMQKRKSPPRPPISNKGMTSRDL